MTFFPGAQRSWKDWEGNLLHEMSSCHLCISCFRQIIGFLSVCVLSWQNNRQPKLLQLEYAKISWKKETSALCPTLWRFQNPPHSLLAVIIHGDAAGPHNARDTSGIMNQTLVPYSKMFRTNKFVIFNNWLLIWFREILHNGGCIMIF